MNKSEVELNIYILLGLHEGKLYNSLVNKGNIANSDNLYIPK